MCYHLDHQSFIRGRQNSSRLFCVLIHSLVSRSNDTWELCSVPTRLRNQFLCILNYRFIKSLKRQIPNVCQLLLTFLIYFFNLHTKHVCAKQRPRLFLVEFTLLFLEMLALKQLKKTPLRPPADIARGQR